MSSQVRQIGRVEAVLELLDEPAALRTLIAIIMPTALRISRGGEGGERAQTSAARASATPAATQASRDVGVLGEALDHADQRRVLQED